MGSGQLRTVVRHIRRLAGAPAAGSMTDGQLLERFTGGQDEAAFETLLERHGPMVLGVCRRLLGDVHDAEDAFQATFLVLVCKAGSIAKRESASSWLHGVAHRIALRAKARAERQRSHTQSLPELPDQHQMDVPTEASNKEVFAALDEELNRLPEKHRAPLVLCYLEGKSRQEAAQQLCWPVGTLQRRLVRGRELLHSRLVRRGVTLSAVLSVTELPQSAALATVPAALTACTLKAAVLVSAGKATVAGAISGQAAALMKGALNTFLFAKVKIAMILLLAVGVLGTGVGTVTHQVLAQRQSTSTVNPASPPAQAKNGSPSTTQARQAKAEQKKEMLVTGQVVDADGKPVVNAQVAVLASPKQLTQPWKMRSFGQTKSATDGAFQLNLPRTSSLEYFSIRAIAAAPGYGLSWQEYDPDGEQPRVTLHLEREQILHGRLVDLQGQPAGKVNLYVSGVTRKDSSSIANPSEDVRAWFGSPATDAEGRFVLRGFGADHAVTLQVRDDRFARQVLTIGADHKDRAKEVHFALGPPRVVTGQVTYADTGKPVADAQVLNMVPGANFDGKTGTDGRYEVPVSDTKYVTVYMKPPNRAPYSILKKTVEWPRGVVRHPIDLALPRGIPVKGKIVEAPSGKPVARAIVQFFPQQTDNPDLSEDVASLWHSIVESDRDGDFQIVLPPGPARLLVSGPTPDYIHQEIAYSILANGKPNYGSYSQGPEGNGYFGGQRAYAHAVVPLQLQRGVEPEPLTVTLRRGVTVAGRVLGADGKPVARAKMLSRLNVSLYGFTVDGRTDIHNGRFELHGCDPEATYRVVFFDEANQQGAVAEIAGKQAGSEPVIVRLAPYGSATARLVTRGQPVRNRRVNIELVITPGGSGFDTQQLRADTAWISNLDWPRYGNGPRTDDQGRLSLTALIPGGTYRFELGNNVKDCMVEPGKTVDWGDILNAVVFREPE